MNATFNSSKSTKRPVIVRVPVERDEEHFTLKEAESILRKYGAKPLDPKKSAHYRALLGL